MDEVTQSGCEKSPLRIKGLIPCRLPIGNLQKSGFWYLEFYTFTSINMKNEKLEIKSVYELSPDEMEELYIEEGNELSLFEGDPDYMVTPDEYPIYFFIWSDKNLVVVSDYSDFDGELLEFCKGQNTSISRSGVNTRSETWHWEYMDYWDNAWDSFKKNPNLKIAYRWWCGYVYTLFEYVE